MNLEYYSKNKFSLILTIYYEKKRRDMYDKVIKYWLNNSSFDIFIVDSYGEFKYDGNSRVKYLSFNQKKYFKNIDKYYHSYSTYLEYFSLRMLWEKYKYFLMKYEYIIKLTGKYILNDLESILDREVKDKMVYVQNNKKDGYNNVQSELFIMKVEIFKEFLIYFKREYRYEKNFEEILGEFVRLKENSRLSRLRIKKDDRVMRGDNVKLKYL